MHRHDTPHPYALTLQPVIMAGGSGTRLWPLSRSGYPKQFLVLQGNTSLLQLAALQIPLQQPLLQILLQDLLQLVLLQFQG